MNQKEIRFLFDYNQWANALIQAACARVTPEQFCAPAQLSHGSLRETLVHMRAAESLWMQRIRPGTPAPAAPAGIDFPTPAALAAYWHAEEEAVSAFIDGLSDEALGQPVFYRNSRGTPFENALWQLLAHVVNHGTQCRSEAAVALTAFGQSPGDLDMLLFIRRA